MNKTRLDNWIAQIEGLPELTRETLNTLQLKRLNETLTRLRERGGFYKDYPDRLDSLEELQKLPFTTAADLAAYPHKFLLTSQSEVSRVISGATSGTTGPAKRVFYTDRDTEHTIGLFTAGIGEMLSPGETCMICFPFSGPFGLGDLIATAVERVGAKSIKAGFGQSWEELCRLTRETQPDTYIGFPVPLLSLIRVYGADFPVKRALVSGDACPAGVMAELEKVLGSRLYPHYGSRECGLGGAVTCPAFEGMHLRENHIIPEIIDEQGNVLPDGEYGELVITTIGADAMPLLRYRTGDFTRILPPCRCGGVTKRLAQVSRHEGELFMEELDSSLFSIHELVDYRVSQKDGISIEAYGALTSKEPILSAVKKLYPHLKVCITLVPIGMDQRPAYLGKRHIIRE